MTEEEVGAFQRGLMAWYGQAARVLPWRGVADPYLTWVSEVMLQQTRVAAAIEHYGRFVGRFPTLGALAGAEESEVLAVWSGLGYYRRARMLHRAARVVVGEMGGVMPGTAVGLRVLPGVGEYTAAAIASIAFGESVAVVDGNAERVLLRVLGLAEERTAAGARVVREAAGALVPAAREGGNAPGDHNQAMMELGATVCLPRGPLCLQCPVVGLCLTRGEHRTVARMKAKRREAAYLLCERAGKVLLVRRAAEASLMAGMWELPSLSLEALAGREPVMRLKHSITDTVWGVGVYRGETGEGEWVEVERLGELALTGLARKVLRRLTSSGPG